MTRVPWAVLLAGLGGLVAGSVVVGGAWFVNATSTYVDRQPIKAPVRIGSFLRFDTLDVSGSGRPDVQRMMLAQNEKSSQRLSESHGGAAAFVQLYYGRDLRQQLAVQVYRQRSAHPLFASFEDYQLLRLVKPYQSAEEFGEVSCLVRNDPTPVGQVPREGSTHATVCSRTSSRLTVEIRPLGQLAEQPGEVATLVDELWKAVAY
jgi:hypothetical protein